jgi:hypothetical protein
MEYNNRLMKPIDPENYFDKEKAVHCNYMKFKEVLARLFDKPVPQIPHFYLNLEYDVEKNNPIFFKQYKY